MSPTAMLESDIRHLCADMAEVKSDVRDLRDRMDGIHDTLLQKIDAGHAALLAKIDANHAAANGKFDDARDKMDALRDKIDANQIETDRKLDTLRDKLDVTHANLAKTNESVADLKGMQKAILWVLGVLAALTAGQVAKLFQWI